MKWISLCSLKFKHCSLCALGNMFFFCLVDPTRIYNKKLGTKKLTNIFSVCIFILFVEYFSSENKQQNYFHFLFLFLVVFLSHLFGVCVCICVYLLVMVGRAALFNHYVFYCWRHYVTGFYK